jgi:hypothetical protein
MIAVLHCCILLLAPVALPSQAPVKPKLTVEFRWIEPHVLKGVTEETGHPRSCGGEDWYAHLKPVLTSQDIAAAKLSHIHMANNDQYAVSFTLKPESAAKLAEACGNDEGRHLTVYVNGRWYGSSYFSKAKPKEFHPPMAGFMLDKAHAEQILEASK